MPGGQVTIHPSCPLFTWSPLVYLKPTHVRLLTAWSPTLTPPPIATATGLGFNASSSFGLLRGLTWSLPPWSPLIPLKLPRNKLYATYGRRKDSSPVFGARKGGNPQGAES
ncbi:hypothetical protein THAOC_35098 [Thalassiosira oceanica]|uniref:Uncharacterized protein n=1 Tax=Thalassiosira oceanica TaxID=159749 RepID=K0R3Y1_THAOC|nr:hypothetical protein THAOC_35098 [Thalassiosira oceanica]|eukprot:EJK46244.1 hypothetical protein THAOC_35098 [Thalassiosira oceanica]